MMKFFTSNFRVSGKDPKAVAISQGIPKWYRGKRMIELAPSWELVKAKIPETEYTRRYYLENLCKLHAKLIVEDLEDGAILLCWEKPGDFCHRRIVAEWIEEKTGIRVPEIEVKKKSVSTGVEQLMLF